MAIPCPLCTAVREVHHKGTQTDKRSYDDYITDGTSLDLLTPPIIISKAARVTAMPSPYVDRTKQTALVSSGSGLTAAERMQVPTNASSPVGQVSAAIAGAFARAQPIRDDVPNPYDYAATDQENDAVMQQVAKSKKKNLFTLAERQWLVRQHRAVTQNAMQVASKSVVQSIIDNGIKRGMLLVENDSDHTYFESVRNFYRKFFEYSA